MSMNTKKDLEMNMITCEFHLTNKKQSIIR